MNALACAAMLLHFTGPLPEVEYWPMSPQHTSLCRLTGQDRCEAVTFRMLPEQGGAIVTVIEPDASWSLRVREAINVVSLIQGRPTHGDAAERANDVLQERAWRDCK